MDKRKILLLSVFLIMLYIPTVNAAYKLDGVYKINGIRKSKIKQIQGAYEYKVDEINEVEVNHILYGMSGTPYDTQDLDDIIGNSTLYQMNAFRYSSNVTGTRVWNWDFVDYLLDNSDLTIVLCVNHYLGESVDVVEMNQTVYERALNISAGFRNNPRIIPEIINEYVFANPPNTVWDLINDTVNSIKDDGITNLILNNKHSNADDWGAIGQHVKLDFHGKHSYFNNGDDPLNATNSLGWAQGHMENAMNGNCIPLVNTEIGASFLGAGDPSFNQTTVDVTKTYILWCRDLDIGNFIWMNKFASSATNHLNKYVDLGLFDGL